MRESALDLKEPEEYASVMQDTFAKQETVRGLRGYEVAELLGVSESTVYSWTKAGALPSGWYVARYGRRRYWYHPDHTPDALRCFKWSDVETRP